MQIESQALSLSLKWKGKITRSQMNLNCIKLTKNYISVKDN